MSIATKARPRTYPVLSLECGHQVSDEIMDEGHVQHAIIGQRALNGLETGRIQNDDVA